MWIGTDPGLEDTSHHMPVHDARGGRGVCKTPVGEFYNSTPKAPVTAGPLEKSPF
jgi:hypothetical protein